MQTLVIYDIASNRIRLRVAEACKDYGLKRVQRSAFRGDLNTNRREMLFVRLEKVLGKHAGSIQIYAFCDKDKREMMAIENAYECPKGEHDD
jgi:CRISPR-associated protein Cas2